jgi:diketogulonate reductase-like aldo/keto reductase
LECKVNIHLLQYIYATIEVEVNIILPLLDLKKQGKARSIGISNYGIHHIEELLGDENTEFPPSVNQIELSPYLQRKELVEYCKSHNITVEAYSPLTKAAKLDDPKLIQIADHYHITPAQLLIQWCLQNNFVTIPKSVTDSRIIENINVLNIFTDERGLSNEDLAVMENFNAGVITGWDPTVNP